ncbi:PREDICTED: UDP-glucuronosyltransferase 2B4-like isoform X4 [Galeopterus variegatus]|uniref:UDP-glucuronosyltransferase n=1 Tax=Galeopterus variegatus TaxID=482537 RepID=A0ABM0RNT0_GALVR|nr:PREDICTED: UDP-glucuronosyltransferase 2B4-like isoform X4 [Galeopterus variegatus]
MSMKWNSVLLLLQLSCYFSSGSCGKVLVWPTEYSHWMNMKTILDELGQRGHEVTVLTSSASIHVDPNKTSTIKFEVYPTSLSRDAFDAFVLMVVKKWERIPKDRFWFQTFNLKEWDQFYSEVLGRPTVLLETMAKAEIWLIRSYWDFDFPRPLLPNFDFVGGFHCKPAKPLPKEMEDFAQSSGEHGVVVFTLGSMISNMPEERANVFASALAQIPQKVIWRFDGKKPDTLGANTRLYKWIPQNDLLGHPKTKAFITHGGGNGVYEAIYHGVPMVGMPLFADQPDNIARMMAKGAAVRLDFDTVSSTDMLNALKTVINDPLYKENIMRLSRINHDQPTKPLDRIVFWIEFVMRHRGAKHLRVAAHDLNWVQYHSLDVIGFLLACVATVIFAITKCCLLCCQKFAKTGKKEKRE